MPMISMPETRYTKSGDVHIAYQVMGSGPLDLVLVPGFVTHLDLQLENAWCLRFFERFSSFCRLILFYKRGTGLSDRVTTVPTLEERMDDVRTVMDAVYSEKAALVGYSEGGPMCVLFSATYPQRTSSLVLYAAMARVAWAPDNPWGRTDQETEIRLKVIEEKWGQGQVYQRFAPSIASNPEYKKWAA